MFCIGFDIQVPGPVFVQDLARLVGWCILVLMPVWASSFLSVMIAVSVSVVQCFVFCMCVFCLVLILNCIISTCLLTNIVSVKCVCVCMYMYVCMHAHMYGYLYVCQKPFFSEIWDIRGGTQIFPVSESSAQTRHSSGFCQGALRCMLCVSFSDIFSKCLQVCLVIFFKTE